MAAGLVAGDTQTVRSTPVKASASLANVCEKQSELTPAPRLAMAKPSPSPTHVPPAAVLRFAPAHQLRYEVARQAKQQRNPRALGAGKPKARRLGNITHYSSIDLEADPEARISVKHGKARALNYLCSLAVDMTIGVISYVQADFADARDSARLPGLVKRLQVRLKRNKLALQDLVAETGNSNGYKG